MLADNPPPPPARVEPDRKPEAGIVDMRDVFARKTPQTEQDRQSALAFIDGKIEMVRRDPHISETEKAAAIVDLTARRKAIENEGREKPSK